MRRYSFGTFVVDGSNREAFEVCQAVADRREVSPLPVTLLGDQGCGKTHLLYSIVNRVRAVSVGTGLAYVTAQDFPDQVRALIDDPSPVERAESAILLIDQLEQFTDLIEELEAVARIFLDHGHYVVLASYIHPGRLPNLPPGFRELIEAGQMIPVLPHTPEIRMELLKREAPAQQSAELERLRKENEEWRALAEKRLREADDARLLLERARPIEDLDQLREELESIRAQKDALGAELEDVRHGLEQALGDGKRLQEEIDHLREELAGRDRAAGEERRRYDEELEQARRRLAGRESLEAEVAALRAQLDEARAESAQAKEEASRLVSRAEELLKVIETNRAEFAKADAEQRQQIENLEESLVISRRNMVSSHEYDEAREEARLARERLDNVRAELELERGQTARRIAEIEERAEREREAAAAAHEAELARLREEMQAALATRDGAEQTAAELKQRIAGLESEVRHVRDQKAGLEAKTRELEQSLKSVQANMDALRQDAASQVASAQAQAGELEGYISQLRKTLEQERARRQEALAGLEALRARLAEDSSEPFPGEDDIPASAPVFTRPAPPPAPTGPIPNPLEGLEGLDTLDTIDDSDPYI